MAEDSDTVLDEEYTAAAYAFFSKTANVDSKTKAAVKKFHAWCKKQEAYDMRMYRCHGRTNGLLRHIYAAHNWPKNVCESLAEEYDPSYIRSTKEEGICTETQLLKIYDGTLGDEQPLVYTDSLVCDFFDRQWLPVAFQLPLWYDGIRTWADMIVYDIKKRVFVLIELKTGYASQVYDKLLASPNECDFLPKTRRVLCHLQLGWMYFVLGMSSQRVDDAYVVRVGADVGANAPEPLAADVLAFYCDDHEAARTTFADWFANKHFREPIADVKRRRTKEDE